MSARIVVALSLFFAAAAWGQARKGASLAELAAYAGPEREQLLYAGAKSEGKVVWYTSLAGSSYKELARAFEAKYPGVKVESYRGTSKDLTSRILAESQARRYLMDALETTLPLLKLLRENRLLTPFHSPHHARYPAESKQADGKLFSWIIDRESYVGFCYNQNSLPAKAAPKEFADLLRPELKGKMGFVTSDTGPRTIGAMVAGKGEEFVRRLKGQEITLYNLSARAMVDLVASGEVGASPSVFRSHASEVAASGAPIAWTPMELVPTNAGGVALGPSAPHPHAALLLVDFLLGPEAQKILERLYYGTPTKDYGFKRWYPEAGMNSEQYEKANERWEKLLREIARRSP